MQRLRADLGSIVRPLQTKLPRGLLVAEPFVGLGGVRDLMSAGPVPHAAMNVFDVDGRFSSLPPFFAPSLAMRVLKMRPPMM